MSEYVGEYIVSLTSKTFTDLRFHRHEEIVRCRDCANASFDEFGGGWCCENCREIKPWDFCAWGERNGY